MILIIIISKNKKIFEVELKFLPTEDQKNLMLKELEFINEENFTDVYYDRVDYSLSLNDV